MEQKSLKRVTPLLSVPVMPTAIEQLLRFKETIATPDLPMLGPQRRSGIKSEAEILRALDLFFETQNVPEGIRQPLRSAALLWHDHLDASHNISQGIETRDGSWLHGIMHRREPDYGNAKYWFRRVTPHDAFPELAEQVTALLKNDDTGLCKRLVEKGEWKRFAFIDECERAESKRDAASISTLRKIQAVEFDVLVESILRS